MAELMSITALGAPRTDPTPPLLPGWLVTYRDRDGRLCGGADDRQHGTIERLEWIPVHRTFEVILIGGQRLQLRQIRSIGQTDTTGKVIAAWTVEDHGHDGARKRVTAW